MLINTIGVNSVWARDLVFGAWNFIDFLEQVFFVNSVNYLFKWRSPDRKSIPEDFQTRVYSADFPPYFLSKVKEIKRLCGDVAGYVAQIKAPIDAEIGQKDHLWMETK